MELCIKFLESYSGHWCLSPVTTPFACLYVCTTVYVDHLCSVLLVSKAISFTYRLSMVLAVVTGAHGHRSLHYHPLPASYNIAKW